MATNPFKYHGSIKNRRRGRAAWQTRVAYATDIQTAVIAIVDAPAPTLETNGWQIEGKATDGAAVIWDFSRFYAHMSEWLARDVFQRAFSVLPGFTQRNAIAEILNSGATIYTTKAHFKLIK